MGLSNCACCVSCVSNPDLTPEKHLTLRRLFKGSIPYIVIVVGINLAIRNGTCALLADNLSICF